MLNYLYFSARRWNGWSHNFSGKRSGKRKSDPKRSRL